MLFTQKMSKPERSLSIGGSSEISDNSCVGGTYVPSDDNEIRTKVQKARDEHLRECTDYGSRTARARGGQP